MQEKEEQPLLIVGMSEINFTVSTFYNYNEVVNNNLSCFVVGETRNHSRREERKGKQCLFVDLAHMRVKTR